MNERRAGWRRLRAGAVFAALAAVVAGCSDSPEQCGRADLGYFTFSYTSPNQGDLFTTVSGTLIAVDRLTAVDPPQVSYTLRLESGSEVALLLSDLGYLLPVQLQSRYSVQLEDYDYPGTLLRGYSIVVRDADSAFVAAVVSDWLPQFVVLRGPMPVNENFDPGPGYPIDGLQVFFSEEGCTPRVIDTFEVRDITNRVLEFRLGSASVRLFHGERGTIGDYEAEVFRAHKITAKLAEAVTPQLSYVLESKAAIARGRAGS